MTTRVRGGFAMVSRRLLGMVSRCPHCTRYALVSAFSALALAAAGWLFDRGTSSGDAKSGPGRLVLGDGLRERNETGAQYRRPAAEA
jgi:hypothetical protein